MQQITLAGLFLKCFEDHDLFFGILAAQDGPALETFLATKKLSLDPAILDSLVERLNKPGERDNLASIANTAAWEAWEVTRGRGPWNP